MTMRSLNWTLAALAAGVMTASACGKDEPPKPQTSAATGATTAAAAADAGAGEAPPKGEEKAADRRMPEVAVTPATGAFAAPIVSRLSKDTFGLVVGTPKALVDGLGLEPLLAAGSAQAKDLVDAMVAATGKNLFELGAWSTIGIDLQAPAGVATLDVQKQGFIAFATLSDAKVFRAFVDDLAKKVEAPLKEEKVGDATLLTMDGRDRMVLVTTDTLVALVVIDRGTGATAYAKELATATPEQSLAGSLDFKVAVSGVASDEAGAYLNLGVIAPMFYGMSRGDGGAASERERAELELYKMVLGDLRGLAFGLDVTAESVELSMRMPLAPDALIRNLVANTTGVFPIVKATAEAPLFLAAGRIDLPGYMRVVDKMLAADGVSLSEIKGQMKELVGIDVDNDILSLFTGELGMVVGGDIKAIMAADNDAPWSKLGGGLALGVTSPDKMKALLGRVAGLKQLARAVRWDEATGVMSVPTPIDLTVTIQVAGNHLVIGSSPALAERVASGDGAGSFTAGLANARLKALVEQPDLAALLVMPQTLGAGWLLAVRGSDYRPSFPPPADPALTPKYEEYLKLRREIDEASEALEKKGMEQLMGVLDKVGFTVEAIKVAPDAIVGTIGQFTKGATVPEVVKEIVELQRSYAGGGDDDAERRGKLEKLWALESELRMPTEVRAIEAVPAPVPAPTPTP